MKTLGQIAFEASCDLQWSTQHEMSRSQWEAAAQAVRAAVIEECAKVCEREKETWSAPEDYTVQCCIEAIRSLK